MENNDLGVELINIISEIEVSSKNALERICQLKNFKDSGSVEAGEMEFLETVKENIQNISIQEQRKIMVRDFLRNGDRETVRLWLNNNIVQLERWKVRLDQIKTGIVILNLTLDQYENRFPKLNVPKCHSEPLEHYLARLREFMELTWKEPAKKNREKEQRSLIDWMRKNHQSKEPNKTTFDTLKTVLIDQGTQISFFLIEHYMLVRAVVSKRKEIKETLHHAQSIMRFLSVEENSVVINAFVSVVQLFVEMLSPAAILDTLDGKDKEKEEESSSKEIISWLRNEIEYGLLHLITIEVLRLEVCFCSPDHTHEVSLATVFHLKESVFKDKLNAKLNELKKEMLSIRDEGSNIVLHRVFELQVKDIWNNL